MTEVFCSVEDNFASFSACDKHCQQLPFLSGGISVKTLRQPDTGKCLENSDNRARRLCQSEVLLTCVSGIIGRSSDRTYFRGKFWVRNEMA